MEFVTFEIAKKLKEKEFNCELPYAMYNEVGQFCLLTTSAPYHVCESGYKYREYYDYNDFDENDFIAPTISQVLKWLRTNKKIYVYPHYLLNNDAWMCFMYNVAEQRMYTVNGYNDYEQAAIAGINYVLYNII